MSTDAEPIVIPPDDEFNRRLVARVHPPGWVNPTPERRYNLVVVGAGSAGLVSAAGAAGLGAKVAIVERHLMGGDCLNVGCVPSKALISAARVAHQVRHADRFGVRVPHGAEVDFPAVAQRMRRLRESISPVDSAERFKSLGVDVYLGEASFVDGETLQVGDRRLKFKKAVIATGGRPSAPPIPGLNDVDYLTNETVFTLTELPRKLAIVGAGPIGCELAQAFARFGNEVYLLETEHGVLPREDREAADIVRASLLADGVKLLCCGKELRFEPTSEGKRFAVESHGASFDVTVDQILIAAGRTPNLEGLGLENAGVAHDKTGVTVNDYLQTSNRNIYAAGDICSKYKFTHMADAMAQIVLQNALFLGRAKVSALTIPWCTYTEPELAHVGLSEAEARDRGIVYDVFLQSFREIDRAILDDRAEGFIKVLTRKGKDRILGATIVADHAGEMISQITLAMTAGVGLGTIAKTIYPYPTQAEAIKKVASAYRKTNLTPLVRKVFEKWLAWKR